MTADRLLALAMAALMVTAGLAVATPVAAADGDAITVQTADATDVTASDATLQGNLTHVTDTVTSADVAVTYWEAGDPANNTTVDAGELTATGEFSAHATGLDNGTTYAYRATAEANGTAVEGSVVEFTTADREIALDVATEPPTNVTDTAATLVANLTELDDAATDASVSFQYWVEGDRSSKEKVELDANGTGTYTAAVENLTAGETYVVRAHAETGASDVNYTADDRGAELTFTTGTGEFGVTTGDASDVTNSSATLNGDLTGLNGSADASVGFEYYPEGDAANASSVDAGERSSVGAFSAEVTGLDNGTTYVYTATASADNATVVGENVTFTPGASDDGPTYEATSRSGSGSSMSSVV
ncbi:hypothetical protein GJ629_07750 [Halapricum sp. CBA1109]|uniref:hypothetical protein n=1 Tax=Halapricum sp. CBA1109 TaxID=2668068 RepID=UPI0012FB3DAD|nr:hypothetical protein [Halapricum sp. CBA1109]MUV89800.1 hypothetical protein [Halapricum sp. CBA1109]